MAPLGNRFVQWRDHIREEKADQERTQYAVDHYHRSLKRQVLLAWHNEMIQQLSIENENEMKLNRYRQEKHQIHLQAIYHRWKDTCNDRRRERCLLQRAELFADRNLQRRCFLQWKEQHGIDLRIKVNSH